MGSSLKNIFFLAIILIIGAVIGSVLGKFVGYLLPEGGIREALTESVTAGLNPTTLDLQVIEFTIGCIFKFNFSSIVGIIIAVMILKFIVK
jgi:hypothetical protein